MNHREELLTDPQGELPSHILVGGRPTEQLREEMM